MRHPAFATVARENKQLKNGGSIFLKLDLSARWGPFHLFNHGINGLLEIFEEALRLLLYHSKVQYPNSFVGDSMHMAVMSSLRDAISA